MSITLFIVLITAAISLLALNNRKYFVKLEYNPFLVHHQKQWYRLLSHAFVHADWMHLIVNMYVLYEFGRVVEFGYFYYFGNTTPFIFILLYVLGILFSALPAYRKHKHHAHYNAVGASGAVSAVVFTSIMLLPAQKLGLLIIPFFHLPAIVFGFLYLAFEYYMDKRSPDNIAHDAHFWGAIFGVVFTTVLEPEIAVNCILQISTLF
ncbi:MAG: rhomboid family intramembrane serine protease [Flavobacteriales bacterium]|nr:MAG: rhomboid family intramembrane serine protease [Flavobacteriales bacterium]